MKVLVAGGAGFIGSHLVDLLLTQKDIKTKVVDNFTKGRMENIKHNLAHPNFELVNLDLRDENLVKEAMEKVDVVFLLAASIGGIGFFHEYPANILDTNAILTSNIINAAVRTDIKRLIYVSSSMVFERTDEFPTPEEAIEHTPIPITSYGFSKLIGEYYCRAYSEEYGLKYTILRPFNAYGPREYPGKEVGEAHVIPDLVLKILKGAYPLPILGNGDQTRSFTYVNDVVEAMYIALKNKNAENQDFNIGSTEETSIKELAIKLWEICGKKEQIKFECLPSYKFDVKRRMPNTLKAKRLLGWEAKTPLPEGLKKTVSWLKRFSLKSG